MYQARNNTLLKHPKQNICSMNNCVAKAITDRRMTKEAWQLVRKLQSQEMEKLCSLKVPTSITVKSSLFPLQTFLVWFCFVFFFFSSQQSLSENLLLVETWQEPCSLTGFLFFFQTGLNTTTKIDISFSSPQKE